MAMAGGGVPGATDGTVMEWLTQLAGIGNSIFGNELPEASSFVVEDSDDETDDMDSSLVCFVSSSFLLELRKGNGMW